MLNTPLQRLSEEVQSWPGITAATHWHFSRNGQVDGADFYRGDDELGHIHLGGDLHLASSPALARALIGAGLARQFPFSGCDEWVVFRIHSEDDARQAAWLLRLAYDYLGGTPEPELLGSIPRSMKKSESAAMRKSYATR